MKTVSTLLIAVPAFLLGSLVTATSTAHAQGTVKAHPASKPASPLPPSPRWEYRGYLGQESGDDYAGLNELGAEGWEAYAYTDKGEWELKRRK